MKKKLLLTTLFLLACFGMAKAETIQVGSGEKGGSYLPLATNWNYSYSQQIYTIAEIGHTGSITSIAFKADGDMGQARTIDLYLVKTDKSSFSSETDFVSCSESDKVFSGTVTFAVQDWTTLTFSQPFEYDGSKNLCVIVNDKTGSYTGAGQLFYVYEATNQSLARINDNYGAYDPASPGSTASNNTSTPLPDYKSQLQLTFSGGGGGGSSETIQVGSGTASGAGMPIFSNWKYGLTQQIYTASEIGKTGTITSIAFQATQDMGQAQIFDIYLVKTSKSTFDDAEDYISASESDKVFSGTVTFAAGDWTTLEFDTPFEYDGSTNLCVIVNSKTGPYSDSSAKKWLVYSSTNQSIWRLNDGYGPYDPASPKSVDSGPTPNLYDYKSQLQLTFSGGGGSKTPIHSVYVNGYEPPVAGENSQNHLNVSVPSGANYYIYTGNGRPVWYNDNDEVFFYDTFVKGTHYSLGVELRANDGYYFADDCVFYLNGGTELLDNQYTQVSSEDNSLVYMWSVSTAATSGISAPTNIEVSDITWPSATVTWESEASAFTLQYKPADSSEWTIVPSIVTTSYTLTELQEQTTYDVRVQAEGGDSWASTTFTTLERFPCPTDIQVLAVAPYSAIINWTDNCGASAWQVAVDYYDNTTDVTRKPFILTGLTPGTGYLFVVRAVIEVDGETFYSNWSEVGSFTTPLPNPLPEISSVTPTPNSATITWEGQSDSYKVKYRCAGSKTVTFFEGFESTVDEEHPLGYLPDGWTIIDADGDGHNWEMAWDGVSPHFNQYEGNFCIVSGSYDNDTSTPLTPDNWLITPKVTLGTGASAWLRGQDTSYPEEHFAFFVSTTGTNPSDFTQVSPEYVATNEYKEYTADLSAYAGQEGYVAIRHYNVTDMFYLNVDNFSIYEQADAEEWNVIETTEKTATLEGLTPDTEYECEVIGIMQGQPDASSSIYTFQTLEANPVPFDVVATPAATTARIEWTGYGDIYHVLYRVPEQAKAFLSENFEGGMGGWTAENLHSYSGISSNAAYSGSQSFRFYYSQTPPQYLISPELSGITEEAILKFQYRIGSTSYPESFKVGYSTTTNSTDAFTWSSELTYGADTDWHEYSQAVPAGTKYIAIQCTSNDQFHFFVDDISVSASTIIPAGEWQGAWTDEPQIVLTGLEKATTYDFKIESYVSGIDTPATTDIMQFTTKAYIIDLVMDNNGDNTSIISDNAGNFAYVTIQNLTLESGKWQGICLPFDVDVKHSVLAGADVRTFESETFDDNKLYLNFLTPVTEMKAGTPYIVKTESDLSNPVFENVTVSTNLENIYIDRCSFYYSLYYYFTSPTDQTQYFKMTGSTGTDLQLILTGDFLHSFEPYFCISSPDSYDEILLNTGEYNDVITGVSSLGETEEGAAIYNLAGMRLSKKQKGVNIVNGKKVLVK